MRRRRWWGAIGVLVVVVVLAGFVSWRQFVQPAGAHRWAEGPADAVVMFGGAGPRFQTAMALMRAGVAPTLVISDPNDSPSGEGPTAFESFCAGHHDFETVCFDPQPRTTRGEARFLGRLAEQRHWRHIVAVTTTEQAARARMLVNRCWDGSVDMVVVDTDLNRVVRVAYEWGATARALAFRRTC